MKQPEYTPDIRLLQALTEQIKLPLLQIAQRAELARLDGQPLDHLDSIGLTASGALKLLDNYLLSIRLGTALSDLELEPVSLAAVLNETAHELSKVAKQHQCDLELHLSGKYEPVLANREGLAAALTSLGLVFIEAQSGGAHEHRPVVKLAAHRGKRGIVAGTFADTEGLSKAMYQRARGIYGQAHQPLTGLTAASGAGVFVAESILSSMSTHLQVARHQKLSGLAATFLPSRQLELV